MSRQGWVRVIRAAVDGPPRPLYARALRLRQLNPSGALCFVYFEGAIILGLLLALAELVSWWGMLVLPIAVAGMVKVNDVVAGVVVRSAARVPEQEQERFRRENGFPPSRQLDQRVGARRGRRTGRHHYA